jgi:hypothetical protein
VSSSAFGIQRASTRRMSKHTRCRA